ncbi:hypothetical protein [Streptomyces gardneri]|uniref:hypothetical protein n=1 Tax=Streptomyces gardneri TaxID=66892 RepID=UPI0036936D92
MFERLDRLQPETDWRSLGEEVEFEELALPAAAEFRTLLTAEIDRLRALFPERPGRTRERTAWFIALEGQAYDDACNLSALERMRSEVYRARREENWAAVAWNLGRVRQSYPGIPLPDTLLTAHDRMTAIDEAADERRRQAAVAAEQAAVDKEIAQRATDEAWAKELKRRARIDSPRVIRVGLQTATSKDDHMT